MFVNLNNNSYLILNSPAPTEGTCKCIYILCAKHIRVISSITDLFWWLRRRSCSGCHCWLSRWWSTGILRWVHKRCTVWPPRKGASDPRWMQRSPVWGPRCNCPIHQLVDSTGRWDWIHQRDGRAAAGRDVGLECQGISNRKCVYLNDFFSPIMCSVL